MREVLMYWLETAVDPHPHWKTIVTALRSPFVNENYLADQLESKYCAPMQHMREESSSHTKMEKGEGIVITTLQIPWLYLAYLFINFSLHKFSA